MYKRLVQVRKFRRVRAIGSVVGAPKKSHAQGQLDIVSNGAAPFPSSEGEVHVKVLPVKVRW